MNFKFFEFSSTALDNPQEKWKQAKLQNKRRLIEYIKNDTGIEVDENMLFDVQIKRIHEYKRQLLNVLAIIHRLNIIFFTFIGLV